VQKVTQEVLEGARTRFIYGVINNVAGYGEFLEDYAHVYDKMLH